MNAIERIALRYGVRVEKRDGENVIPGRVRGSELYYNGHVLCLMIVDGPVIRESRYKLLQASENWFGDVSIVNGRRCQDVVLSGIPDTKIKEVLKLIRAKKRRKLSYEHKQSLIEAGKKWRLGKNGNGKKPGSQVKN